MTTTDNEHDTAFGSGELITSGLFCKVSVSASCLSYQSLDKSCMLALYIMARYSRSGLDPDLDIMIGKFV